MYLSLDNRLVGGNTLSGLVIEFGLQIESSEIDIIPYIVIRITNPISIQCFSSTSFP